jgi:hypothetical protein
MTLSDWTFPLRATSSLVFSVSMLAAATGAQARTCAVEVEELREIRRLALDLVGQNVKIEPGRAAAAQKKVMQALQNGGSISIDPADLKGIVSLKGKPSKAAVRQLLRRVQKIFESCNI